MKRCSKIHPLLSLEAEGALSSRDHKKVQAHLRDCADARKELASYKRMRRTLRALPDPKKPGNLHEKIMTRLHQKKSSKSENFFHFRPLWPVAAAAATTVFFFIQYPNWQDRMTSQSKTAPVETNRPAAQQAVADKKSAQALQSPSRPMAFAHAPSANVMKMAAPRSKDETAGASVASGNSISGPPASAPPVAMAFNEAKKTAHKSRIAAPSMAMARANSLDSMQGASVPAESPAPEVQKDLESDAVSTWRGDQDSRTPVAQQSLLLDEASFETVWNSLEVGKPVPAIDFTTQAVVLLEGGLEPGAGFGIQILQMEDKPSHLVIHWGDTKPAPGGIPSQVATYPWILKIIDKPSKPVTFTEDE
jgi:hypothetical protein